MEQSILSVKKIIKNSRQMSENLKSLRANLEFCGAENRTIAFTSCIPGEGKSTTSLKVAAELASTGKRVLFIDADMRKSNFREKLGVSKSENTGLSEFLAGQNTAKDVLHKTDIDNLFLILAGKVPPNPAELLSLDHFDKLLKSAQESFEYIIIDTPPIGSVIDSAIVGRKCDGVVIVVGSDMISCRMLSKVIQQLRRADCKILGAVVNKIKVSNRSLYGTYGSSKYYYGYYGQESEDSSEENN